MYILQIIYKIINGFVLYKIFNIPLLIWCFVGVGILIMIKIKFANIIYLLESLKYAFGKKNKSESINEGIGAVTTLMSQLAANLGVGNFAGSAIALYYGGPGVIFWFLIISFFASAIKFAEVVLAHKYRIIENEEIKGGNFYFIEIALSQKYGIKKIAKVFAVIAAIGILFICIATSSMQLNQINVLINKGVNSGICLKSIVSTVIIGIFVIMLLFGGLKKIGFVADIMVPIMGILYVIICIAIIIKYHYNLIPALILVKNGIFNLQAGISSIVVTILFALQKIINATDTGVGFSAISQSNSNVKMSGQQGLISFFDPFIVAIIMSFGAFAIIISNTPYQNQDFAGMIVIKNAFISLNPLLEYVLIIIAIMFGFTTIMSAGFFLQQACIYIFKKSFVRLYAILYILIYSIFSFYNQMLVFLVLDVVYSFTVIINLIAIALLVNEIKNIWNEYIIYTKNNNL